MAAPGVALPPFLVAGGSLGSGKCGPRPAEYGERSLGLYLCPTPWAAKASLHSLGVRRACRADGRRPRWCVRSTGGAVACFAAARCWVVRGVLLGEVCPAEVVVVRGRPRPAGVTVIVRSSGGRRRSRVSSLCVAGVGLVPCACGRASSLQVLWSAAGQGPGGLPTRRTKALRRALKNSCTRAACAARASVSVRMAGCSCPPSASARIW